MKSKMMHAQGTQENIILTCAMYFKPKLVELSHMAHQIITKRRKP